MTADQELLLRWALTAIIVLLVICGIAEVIRSNIADVDDIALTARNWTGYLAIAISVCLILWAIISGIWTMEIGKK